MVQCCCTREAATRQGAVASSVTLASPPVRASSRATKTQFVIHDNNTESGAESTTTIAPSLCSRFNSLTNDWARWRQSNITQVKLSVGGCYPWILLSRVWNLSLSHVFRWTIFKGDYYVSYHHGRPQAVSNRVTWPPLARQIFLFWPYKREKFGILTHLGSKSLDFDPPSPWKIKFTFDPPWKKFLLITIIPRLINEYIGSNAVWNFKICLHNYDFCPK